MLVVLLSVRSSALAREGLNPPTHENTQSLKYQEHIPARYDPHVQPGSKPAIQPLNELIKEGERPASKNLTFLAFGRPKREIPGYDSLISS